MSVTGDPQTAGRVRLSFANNGEIDEFVATLESYERGEITAEQWRKYRLVRGLYGQRQAEDAQMLRVKIPQGVLNGEQLHALADVADRYSRGFGHITTRQNVQLHFMALSTVEPAMRHLAAAGLTTREACGNSVRNIVACPYAGVAHDEIFDVTPYAEALTRYLLRHPLSASLPRKFKIAFEGCASDDHVFAAINDIGWRAALAPDGSGRRGFRVNVGGGTAIMCRSGSTLHEFLPAGEILALAEAVIRVFHAHGDYEHRQRNRMKFLIKTMGWDAFRDAVQGELTLLRLTGVPPLPFDPEHPPVEASPDFSRASAPSVGQVAALVAATATRGPGIAPRTQPFNGSAEGVRSAWLESNVRRQKQPGFNIVTVTLPLGDISGGQLRVLAALADAYADGLVRTTVDQNLMLRWVRPQDVGALFDRLASAGLAEPGAGSISDVTSCPGAETCKLAVTQSRGLARLVRESFAEQGGQTAGVDLKIKVSGCPNGCGQHHVAGIGFQGSIRKVGDRVVPQYFVMLGGGAGPDGASFGRLTAKIPARRVPEAIQRLVDLYEKERTPRESATAFFARVDQTQARAVLADLEPLTIADARDDDFIDPGEDRAFVPDIQDGECSA
jgi:sulfite reductase (NADPH) hemoprotein beta-component